MMYYIIGCLSFLVIFFSSFSYLIWSFVSLLFGFLSFNYCFTFFNSVFSCDFSNLFLIFLNLFTLSIICISSSSSYFRFLFVIIHLLIFFCIITNDLIIFFISFESIVIPIFLLINLSSSQYKLLSSLYFIGFTIFSSFFFFVAIFIILILFKSSNIFLLHSIHIPVNIQFILFIPLVLPFLFKLPIIPFHIWLPLAHTDAPLSGSLILAALLLKLGGLFFYKFVYFFIVDIINIFVPYLISLGLISSLLGCFLAFSQSDLKKFIAYTSIAHMSLVAVAYFSCSLFSFIGGNSLLYVHALTSSALFILVTFLYDSFHTRLIFYYRGIANSLPVFAIFFFLFILSNIALPPTLNFWSEFLILGGIVFFSPLFIGIFGLIILFTVFYSFVFSINLLFGSCLFLPRFDIPLFLVILLSILFYLIFGFSFYFDFYHFFLLYV